MYWRWIFLFSFSILTLYRLFDVVRLTYWPPVFHADFYLFIVRHRQLWKKYSWILIENKR